MLGEEYRFAMYGGGHILVLFGFIFSLLFAIIDKRQNAYLYLIAILSYLSLLMTATRVWFLVLTLILIVFVVKSRRFGKTAIFLFIVFSIGLLVSSYNISSKSKTRATTERLTSVFSLGEKDSAASQMIDYKWRQRLPKVIDGFKENPIFGWGFSNKAFKILDDDVGNFSLLAETGILGLLFFIFFWVKYFRLISITKKISAKNSPLFKGFSILNVSFFGFLLAHFSTHQFFGLTLAQYHLFFICIFLFLSEFFVWENFRLVNETQVL
jgi:O-antigen ligase